jgi:hypothetical protein
LYSILLRFCYSPLLIREQAEAYLLII